MKIGVEPKKIAILGGLALVGGYVFYANVLSGPSAPPAKPVVPAREPTAPTSALTRRPQRTGSRTRTTVPEFRPSLATPRKPEDRLDPMTFDPKLRLDLLARVQSVQAEAPRRNLFQFVAAPAASAGIPAVGKIRPGPMQTLIGPKPPPQPVIPVEPAKPVAPPINLKYYGYSTVRRDGKKRAFFLDGDDILVAEEGETVKQRYKVVRIGVNSVVMEDTQFHSQQTLPLQEEATG